MSKPFLRNRTYHLRMRVPQRYAAVESRTEILRSLKTDSYSKAVSKHWDAEQQVLAELDAKLSGTYRQEDHATHYEAIAALAASHGYRYKTSTELAEGSLDDLVSRVLRNRSADPDTSNAALTSAMLGGLEHPRHRVSDLPALYEEEQAIKLEGREGRDRDKWSNPYSEAAAELVEAAGDKYLDELTRDDFVEKLGNHIRTLITKGRKGRSDRLVKISTETARKKLSRLSTLLSFYRRKTGKDLVPYIKDISLVEAPFAKTECRPEVPEDWMLETILTPGPLDKMNQGARDMLTVMSETGAIASELCRAPAEAFRLDDPFPHIDLKKLRLKTETRPRCLALCGPALEAARRWPTGFPYDKGENLSAVVRKYMAHHQLWPDDIEKWVPYCIRHAFEGRMRRAGINNFFAARMMGHSAKSAIGREVYGDDLKPWQCAAVMDCIRLDSSLEARQVARRRLDEIMPAPEEALRQSIS